MKPEDFVFNQIYKGALSAGANERSAKDHAVMGVEDFSKSRFNPAAEKKKKCGIGDLVRQRIQMARKE